MSSNSKVTNMNRRPWWVLGVISSGALLLHAAAVSTAAAAETTSIEQYVEVPMPPGFRVEVSPTEGPVFADENGRTLYIWPQRILRNGYAGETPGNPNCYGEVRKHSAGLMSPYPPDLELPELDTRPSCTDLWPPVLAGAGAETVGKWTTVDRKDGTKQWAYDERPLYTSVLDKEAGDALGGTTRRVGGAQPVTRTPIGPPSLVPPGFKVRTTLNGRLLTTDSDRSVYAFDKDTADKSACDAACMRSWTPIVAPNRARPQGEWALLERSPGVKQWVYRGKPVYTHNADSGAARQEGSDVPGWSNVYTQLAPPPPPEFTIQETMSGTVLADSRGMTIYLYSCGDDSYDQLSCEHPTDTQVYRLAVCGGTQERCMEVWPYVMAEAGSASANRAWTVMAIDPATGHLAKDGQQDAINVWAFRDRPVFTYYRDIVPGDVQGAGTGEWRGGRNGLLAFWIRDDFFGGGL